MQKRKAYARALRASQNRKEDSIQRAGSITLPPPSKVETVHEIFKDNKKRVLIYLGRGHEDARRAILLPSPCNGHHENKIRQGGR